MKILTMPGMVLLCAACQLEEREAQPHGFAAKDLVEACVPPEYEYLRFELEKQHAGRTGAEAGHRIEFNIRVRKDQLENCDFSEVKVCLVAKGKSEVIKMSSDSTNGYNLASGASSRDAEGRYDIWTITCDNDGNIKRVSAQFGHDGSKTYGGLRKEEGMDYSGFGWDGTYAFSSDYLNLPETGKMLTPQRDNNCFPESPSACRTSRAGEN